MTDQTFETDFSSVQIPRFPAVYTVKQTLTDEQKAQARENIGAVDTTTAENLQKDATAAQSAADAAQKDATAAQSAADAAQKDATAAQSAADAAQRGAAAAQSMAEKSVSFHPQTLTDEQKAQARKNIGAAAPGEGGGGGGGATPDWNAAEGEPGHILNRPFYTEGGAVILEEMEVSNVTYDGIVASFTKHLGIEVGQTYTVVCGGVAYECVGQDFSAALDVPAVALGDLSMLGLSGNGEPFMLYDTAQEIDQGVYGGVMTEEPTTIAIYRETVHKLPGKFLPDGVPYAEQGEPMVLLPATEAQATDDGFFITSPINGVEVGKTYIVNYNGTDYKGIAKDASAFASNSAMLGNSSVLGFGEDSGEPFLFVVFPPERLESDGFSAMIAAVDGASSVTLSISLLPEKLNKIDPRLLPDDVAKDFLIVKSIDGMITATHTGADIYSAVGIDRKLCFFDFFGKPLPAVIINEPGILRFETIHFADAKLYSNYVVVEEDGTISDWGETAVNI